MSGHRTDLTHGTQFTRRFSYAVAQHMLISMRFPQRNFHVDCGHVKLVEAGKGGAIWVMYLRHLEAWTDPL